MMKFPGLSSPAILSPMVGVTDVAFRTLAKRYGAGLTYTEFVSSAAIVRKKDAIEGMLATDPSERPVAVQLFGSSIKDVVDAARLVEDRFDVIDINFGCPAWKVIKTGAGADLLKKPQGIASFVNRLATAVNKPVTIKIRSGIDEGHINAVEVAKAAEDAGAAAIAIHGRTAAQGYRGKADWDIIKQVKDAVNIPVIGNGDVFSPETFRQRLEESGVDCIMVARGALGNPHIFHDINAYLKTGGYEPKDRIEQFLEYYALAEKYHIPFIHLKNHAMGFTKGLPGGTEMRERISRLKTGREILRILGFS